MKTSPKLVCPSCCGSRLALGNPGPRMFVPQQKLMLVGLPVYYVACLDCGHVGYCLSEVHRSKLEEKLQSS